MLTSRQAGLKPWQPWRVWMTILGENAPISVANVERFLDGKFGPRIRPFRKYLPNKEFYRGVVQNLGRSVIMSYIYIYII